MGRAFGAHSFSGYLGFALAPIFMDRDRGGLALESRVF